jgi:hypothetical protein
MYIYIFIENRPSIDKLCSHPTTHSWWHSYKTFKYHVAFANFCRIIPPSLISPLPTWIARDNSQQEGPEKFKPIKLLVSMQIKEIPRP